MFLFYASFEIETSILVIDVNISSTSRQIYEFLSYVM